MNIPNETKRISQFNKGNLLGTLSATKNIDLNNEGIITLAQRTRYIGQTSSGNFTDILSIVYGNFQSTTTTFQYWLISSGGVFTCSEDLASFAADALASTPTPGFGGDGCAWNGNLYVSKASRISKLAAGTWTASWSSADFTTTTASFPHPIEPNVTNANLLAGDGNLLKKVIADGTISTAITLPTGYKIIWIRRGVNVNYIGLEAISGGRGAVAVWDGLDTTLEANTIIGVNTRSPLCGVMDDEGVLNIMTVDGRLMRFNGSGFSDEAQLPVFSEYRLRRNWGASSAPNSKVSQRGMCVIRGKIHVSVDNSTNDTPVYMPQFPGGVWVYDRANKAFYNRFTPSNANTVTDFGQFAGTKMTSAIFPIVEDYLTEPTAAVGGVLLTGARVSGATAATTYRVAISVTTGENRGQFETCRVEALDVTQGVPALWCKFQGVETSSDKIVFKYRTRSRIPLILSTSQVWTSSTVFTTTDTDMASVEVGDEIMVLFGNGAGSTAHITTIVNNAGTYTVTVDEAITGISATNEGWIMVNNWKKVGTQIDYNDTFGYKRIPLEIRDATWFQVKVELRGEGGKVAIEQLQLINKKDVPTT
jgi:hypothetical protein